MSLSHDLGLFFRGCKAELDENGQYFDCLCTLLTVQVVQCSTEGFCREGIEEQGHNVVVTDLYAQNFNPLPTKSDTGRHRGKYNLIRCLFIIFSLLIYFTSYKFCCF